MTNQKKFLNGLIRWLPLVGLVLFFGLILWGYSRGIFHSVASLQAFIKQFGNYAVLCFILLQIVQVIIPILPGGISSVAGMLMFGNLQGLLYSYLGLIIGEFIGFLLVRYYGRSFVKIILFCFSVFGYEPLYFKASKLVYFRNNRYVFILIPVQRQRIFRSAVC